MKKFIKLTLILLVMAGTSSCMLNGVRGDGDVVTKKRKISNDFVRIEASRGLDVYITKSKKVSLEVEADQNLHELIQTEVRDGTLFITSSRNIYSASAKKIHLSADNINAIHVNSGAEVYSENTLSTERLHVSSGAGTMLEVNVEDLSCSSSSGAEVNLSGKAHNFKASSSSGSNINAYDLSTTNCNANASSGSDIDINVSNVFEATATSGAGISYKGNPDRVSKNNNSGGSISQVRG